MSNPFSKFQTKVSKVAIKALGATVEIREPTIAEVSDFYKLVTDEDGKFNASKFLDAKLQRIASCMVKPKITIEELSVLSSSASDAVNEVYEAIENLLNPDKEGNES